MTDKIRLFCVVPLGGRALEPDIADFLVEARALFRARGWRFFHKLHPDKATASTRNFLCHEFLRSGCDLFMTMDSDARPNVSGLLALVEDIRDDEIDVVSAWTLIFRANQAGMVPDIVGPPEVKTSGEIDWPIQFGIPHGEPGLYEVTGGGFGAHCFVAKRRVIQKFYDEGVQWFEDEFWDDKMTAPLGKFGLRKTGHDLMFCQRAAKLGFRLWVDNRVLWGHFKKVDLVDWYRQVRELSQRLAAQRELINALQLECHINLLSVAQVNLPPEFLMRHAIEQARLELPITLPEEEQLILNKHPVSVFMLLNGDTTEENRALIQKHCHDREVIDAETVQCEDGRIFSVVSVR